MDRRDFLKSGAAAGALAATGGLGACASPAPAELGRERWTPARDRDAPHVVVIGAGAFGAWTALNLRRLGAPVTLVDAYGPGNSRATSGGETRGVRSSYGDRPHGLLWGRWAAEAIRRWRAWDEMWSPQLLPRLFFNTGDLIFRPAWEPFLERTRENWDELGHPYEVLDPDEVARRWPVIDLTDIEVILYEPDAGVVRARRAIESVAEVFRDMEGEVVVERAAVGRSSGRHLDDVVLASGDRLEAATFVFALGPWFPYFFPEILGDKIRTPQGNVVYFATPVGDERFRYPNIPSYNFRGVTGWPALPRDSRGFRVRTGGRAASHPDVSDRRVSAEDVERPRQVLQERFPLLADAPVLETRRCHYESSVSRNFIIAPHPGYENVWIAGGGSAEAFKFGPVLGEYIAERVLGLNEDPYLVEQFRIPEATADEDPGDAPELP